MPLCKRVARLIMEVILSRRIGGTERHGRLRVIIRCKREKNSFVKIIYIVVVVCFLLLHTSYTRNRGACVTPQNVTWRRMVRWGVHRRVTRMDKEANPTLLCNPGNVGRNE
jgi:hypothetical protein